MMVAVEASDTAALQSAEATAVIVVRVLVRDELALVELTDPPRWQQVDSAGWRAPGGGDWRPRVVRRREVWR